MSVRAKYLAKVTSLLIAVMAVFAMWVCSYYHIYSPNGWLVYRAMQHECHPAWRDYNFRRVKAGDDLDDVTARTNPISIERNGRWVILRYQTGLTFTGLSAVAYDGKMVFASAGSCSWVRLFFDELTEEQSLEYLGRSKSDPRRLGIVPVYRS